MLANLANFHSNLRFSLIKRILAVAVLVFFVVVHPEYVKAENDQDGPVSVAYGNIFEMGELKIEPFDLKVREADELVTCKIRSIDGNDVSWTDFESQWLGVPKNL